MMQFIAADGQRYVETTGTADKRTALAMLREREEQIPRKRTTPIRIDRDLLVRLNTIAAARGFDAETLIHRLLTTAAERLR